MHRYVSRRLVLLMVGVALLSTRTARAQPAALVSDIRTVPDLTPGAFSGTAGTFASRYYFRGCDDAEGCELWSSDGTAAGTRLVKDIAPGPASGLTDLAWAEANGVAFFWASDGATGTELWKTDGSAAGTVLVKDINPGPASSGPGAMVSAAGKLFFAADDGVHGTEIWVSDGTAAGTALLKDVRLDGGSFTGSLAAVGTTVFFSANDGEQPYGNELWKTDGTPAGTALVRDIFPGTLSSSPHCFHVLGSLLLFAAGDFDTGPELYRSDGTEQGTWLVKDINPGSQPSSISCSGATVPGALLFAATDGTSGLQLWRSDGTAAGTAIVSSVAPWLPAGFAALGGAAFFAADDGTSGVELWRSDGTAQGTTLVRDVRPGAESAFPVDLFSDGSQLFFGADDGVSGREPWRSDGTAAGTTRVADINPGAGGSIALGDVPPYLSSGPFGAAAGAVFLGADDGANGLELWRSDGSTGGTLRLTDRADVSSRPSGAVYRNGAWFFAAEDDSHGRELWRSDGTAQGTALVADILPGAGGSFPGELAVAGGRLYFAADDGVHGREPWTSDGTAAGTVLLADALVSSPFGISSEPGPFVELNGAVYFTAYTSAAYRGSGPQALWKTDGTPEGTVRVHDLGTRSGPPALFRLGSGLGYFDDCTVFLCLGSDLYVTDGTAAGGVRLGGLFYPRPQPTFAGGTAYFPVAWTSEVYGPGLWKTDGTPAGTVRVRSFPSPPSDLAALGGALLFAAEDTTSGRELWTSDGSEAGTRLLADIKPGAAGSAPSRLTALGPAVYFSADDGSSGRELWRTDGTQAGTAPVADIAPGAASSFPDSLTAVNGALFFTADDGSTGQELWRSDGTSAALVQDLAPGPRGSGVESLSPGPDGIFFGADDGSHGSEPWLIPPLELPLALTIDDVRVREGSAGTTTTALFTVRLSAPAPGAVSVDYATEDGSATAGQDYTAASGTLAFAASETAKTIAVTIAGDSEPEGDETFSVKLSNPAGAAIVRDVGLGTILEDDSAVVEWFRVSPAIVAGPGEATLSWSTAYADSVSISGLGSHGPFGSVTTAFTQTTSYTLTASGPGGTATARATVNVLPPPGTSLGFPRITTPAQSGQVAVTGVSFAWDEVAGAGGYDLRVFDGANGATVFTGSLLGSGSTSTLISLPAGLYLFAVRACGSAFADAFCDSFATVDFKVSPTTPTLAPTIASPAQGASLTASTQTLEWTAVAKADPNMALALFYEVLLEDLQRGETALQIAVPDPDLQTIVTLRSSTSYRLRVRACQAGCGPYSAAVTFSMALSAPPTTAPAITSAAVTGGNSLDAQWTSVTGADLYRFQVVQPTGGPGGGALTVAARQVSSTSVNVPVPAGTANLVVQACTGDGCGPFSAPFPITPAGPNPDQPNLGTPLAGSVVDGPVVDFSWSRVPGDDGTNTVYRLFVQDLSRQATALDVFTRDNFYAAYFKAEGARYDALVIANPGCTGASATCSGAQTAGPAVGFNVRGTSATAPTMVQPAHQGTTPLPAGNVTQGNIQLGWSPVPGATLYEYFVAVQGQGQPTVTGVTPGLFVRVPLAAAGGADTVFSGIVRACPAGATCVAGSDAGWGPWSNQAGPGVTNFTVTP